MRKSNKVIITCAPTGSIHTPSMSPHLPVTPDQIAEAAIGAAEAGAAVLHLHARNPADGSPSPKAEDFMAFLPRIKQATDAVINISTIFDFSVAGRRVAQWQHAWERDYVESSRGRIMYNDNLFIERIMVEIGQAYGTRFEFECYDVGHLYTLAHFADRKLVEPPFLIQGVIGILGGIGPDVRNLAHMVTVADSLFGDDYMLSAFAAGRYQMDLCTQSVLLGGHARVGLEDSLYIGKGELATSNAQQVARIRQIVEALGREVATPAEAREMLGLKGGDQVAF